MHVVLNPTSGSGSGRRLRDEIEAALRTRGADVQITETRGRGHAVELAESLATAGAPLVVAAGGDGTVHEVVNGLLRAGRETALGLIPIGTGNDFVKVVPGTRSRAQAYDTLFEGRPRPYDAAIARWDGGQEYFVNAAGTGIDVEVVRQIESLRGLPGALTYILGLARALVRYRPIPLRVTARGGLAVERRVMLAVVSNGQCVGGAFRLTPDALPDDGLLDLCLVAAVSLLTAVRVAPRVLRGTHLGHSSVLLVRDTAFDITVDTGVPLYLQLDGELRRIDGSSVHMEVLPGVLHVMAAADSSDVAG